MDAKIRELTEQVYNEGVRKGAEEAERLITEAKTQAEQIQNRAEQQAEQIIRKAEQQAEELKNNTERELKLYAKQLVETTQASLATSLSGQIAQNQVKALMTDPQFIQAFMLKVVEGFHIEDGLEISGANAEELAEYIRGNARYLLEKELKFSPSSGKPYSFTVAPSSGGFKLEIGEAEFLELFKTFVRPQLVKMLF